MGKHEVEKINLKEALSKMGERTVFIESSDTITNSQERSKDGDSSTIFVSPEVRRAGKLLREARTIYEVTAFEIAGGLKREQKKSVYITDFEEGKVANPDLTKISKRVEKYIDEEDERIKELREIAERRTEEAKWLWKIEQEGIVVNEAVKFIRLLQGDTKKQFAHKTSISPNTLRLAESEGNLKLSTLNEMLTKTGFDQKQKRVAQRIRLLVEDISPIRIDSFQEESFADNIKYLRIQEGFSKKSLGKNSGFTSADRVKKIELDRSIHESAIDSLLDGLGIPESLREFMFKKAKGEKVNLSADQKIALSENYYFLDAFKEYSVSPFTRQDEQLSEKLIHIEKFGEGFRMVRENLGLSQYDLGKTQSYMSRIELGKVIPEDFLIGDLIKMCKLGILDKTTQALLSLAEKDKKGSRRGSASK